MNSLDIIKQHIIKTLTLYNLSRKNKSLRAELGKIHSLADKLSKNNGWISIDNPPPHSDRYLCQVKSRDGEISIEINYLYSDDNAYNKRILGVTHWQYLPDEVESENDE